jgi:hypothetical protein
MWTPDVDMFQRGHDLVVRVDLSGCGKEDLTVSTQRHRRGRCVLRNRAPTQLNRPDFSRIGRIPRQSRDALSSVHVDRVRQETSRAAERDTRDALNAIYAGHLRRFPRCTLHETRWLREDCDSPAMPATRKTRQLIEVKVDAP